MPVNWNDKDVLERLFIAALASLDNKVRVTIYHYSPAAATLTSASRRSTSTKLLASMARI
jgi:hypothetical protein